MMNDSFWKGEAIMSGHVGACHQRGLDKEVRIFYDQSYPLKIH